MDGILALFVGGPWHSQHRYLQSPRARLEVMLKPDLRVPEKFTTDQVPMKPLAISTASYWAERPVCGVFVYSFQCHSPRETFERAGEVFDASIWIFSAFWKRKQPAK